MMLLRRFPARVTLFYSGLTNEHFRHCNIDPMCSYASFLLWAFSKISSSQIARKRFKCVFGISILSGGASMTLKSVMGLVFLGGLFIILSPSLLWLWVDYREQKRVGWTSMRNSHLHHVFLCIWPILLAILVVFRQSYISDLFTWGCVLLTGILLYSAGIWDMRFERIGVEPTKIEVTSNLLARLALRFPLGEVVFGIIGIGISTPILLWVIFPISPAIRVILCGGLVVVLSLVTFHLVKIWNQQMFQRGRPPIYWI